jgi:hypothetical protein
MIKQVKMVFRVAYSDPNERKGEVRAPKRIPAGREQLPSAIGKSESAEKNLS